MRILGFLSKRNISITYAITVCNEKLELGKLLTILFENIDLEDQVIVLQDISNLDTEVHDLIKGYGAKVLHLQGRLLGDFSQFKNQLIPHARGDYMFQLDADEIPSLSLIEKLKSFLSNNKKGDCFLIPRVNIVHDIEDKKLEEWNWSQNKDGYINFPDFQMRLFKIKNEKIHWVNNVHETLVGYKKLISLPVDNYDYCLIHEKGIDKQIRQNDFYNRNF